MDARFSDVVTTEAQLRDVLGNPSRRVIDKQVATLDDHSRKFLSVSPFVLLASCDAAGNMDVSPKGDPAGFVHVLDDKTFAIPDRLGNRRADTIRNVLQNPNVGMIFLVPGKEETLRINGTAIIVRDRWLREQMAIDGKLPDQALVITVKEVFFHCAKCVIRSKLWQSERWPDLSGQSSLAQAMVDEARLTETVAEMQAIIDRDVRERLY
jgi:uncharacterized protein